MAKSAKKKEAICRVATRLFVEKGFEKTSIRDIAEAGNMNSSGIYYYFDDKEAILYTILIELMDESLARMQEIANLDVPLKEKIYAAIDLHTEVYGADPIRMALIAYNQKSLNTEHWDELREKQKRYSAIVRGFLAELKEDGETADLNPTLCTFALFGMIQSAYLWYDPRGKVKPDELKEMFARIFTGGILADEAERKESGNRRLAR
ncbi:MAG: TetR family transcriptional regulator [Thermodesulfobacteriota bacterium]